MSTLHCTAPSITNKSVMQIVIGQNASDRICFPFLNVFYFTHGSCLYFPLTEWKAPGSLCKQVQQYIKGEQSTHKWKDLNEWCTAFIHLREREHIKDRREADEVSCGGRQRLTGQIHMQLIDNLPHSHHIAPISSASLINHKSTDVSSNLSSSAQCGCICLCLSSPSPLHRSLGQSLHQIWLQGFNHCSPEPLIG